jgi:Fe-S-cluster containining protein
MFDVVRRQPRREETAPAEILCTHCPAKCCRYFALPIDTPTTWTDFDTIRWFLLHDRATVFNDEGTWHLLVHSRCRGLRADNLCSIYETRPRICRSYSTTNCEHADDGVYDQYWETPEQIEEYAEAVLGPRRGHGFRSPRPGVVHGDKPRGSLACPLSPDPSP